MPNILNINAESGANIIGDDAQPTLTLTNSSSGAALEVSRLVVTSTATLAGDINLSTGVLAGPATISGRVVFTSSATATNQVNFVRTVIGSPSVATAVFSVSGASIPVMEFQANALVSAVSIVFAASANWAGMSGVRVKFSDGVTYGWIPVLPSAVFTAAAI